MLNLRGVSHDLILSYWLMFQKSGGENQLRLIGFFPFFTSFYTSHVVIAGFHEPSTVSLESKGNPPANKALLGVC